MDTFIVGLGYVGAALAQELVGAGGRVVGTTRDEAKARRLRANGVEVHVTDLADAVAVADLWPHGAALVHTAPPSRGSVGEDRLATVLAQRARNKGAAALVYLSTTGLYAERDGGWVDEESPTAPRDAAAQARLVTEEGYLRAAMELGIVGVAFRLAGIYGPGRGLRERVREGRVRLWGGGHQILNRVHRDDIVRFVRAALAAPASMGGIYNLADDEPASLREQARYHAELLGLPVPPDAPMVEAPSPTLTGSRRVSNAKAKRVFALELHHPTFRLPPGDRT